MYDLADISSAERPMYRVLVVLKNEDFESIWNYHFVFLRINGHTHDDVDDIFKFTANLSSGKYKQITGIINVLNYYNFNVHNY